MSDTIPKAEVERIVEARLLRERERAAREDPASKIQLTRLTAENQRLQDRLKRSAERTKYAEAIIKRRDDTIAALRQMLEERTTP